jgi:hypothetical protein
MQGSNATFTGRVSVPPVVDGFTDIPVAALAVFLYPFMVPLPTPALNTGNSPAAFCPKKSAVGPVGLRGGVCEWPGSLIV